jgi:hypothetical protein
MICCLNRLSVFFRAFRFVLLLLLVDQQAISEVNSWSTGEQYARELLLARGVCNDYSHGWTVALEDDDTDVELMGYDYLLDLISELEVPPCSPMCKSFFLIHDGRDRSSKARRHRHGRTATR